MTTPTPADMPTQRTYQYPSNVTTRGNIDSAIVKLSATVAETADPAAAAALAELVEAAAKYNESSLRARRQLAREKPYETRPAIG